MYLIKKSSSEKIQWSPPLGSGNTIKTNTIFAHFRPRGLYRTKCKRL